MKNLREYRIVQFLLSKEFWKQVKVMLAIFFAIIFLSSIILYCVTRHNSMRTVPDFNGLSLNDARELADDYSLRIAVSDSLYNMEKLPGTVLEHEPKTGTFVKKNRRIFLVMNAVSPEKVHMPDVVGVSLRQAVAILESNGLYVENFKYVQDIATNIVLKQSYGKREIVPGKNINKGSGIDLTLGRAGWLDPVTIPELKGLKLLQARKQTVLSYLNIGKIYFDYTIKNATDSINACIYKQKPKFVENQTVAMGSKVDIWLSLKKNKDDKKSKK
jgi:eukaryotic-like serine/threonine-protein kinase